MAVTIKDIASKANVSIATVSRYLNNPEVVSVKTGKAIQEAIEELDYTGLRLCSSPASANIRQKRIFCCSSSRNEYL